MLTEAPPAFPVCFFCRDSLRSSCSPYCEEMTCRLLLHGGLERWEDERLGWRRKAASEPSIDQQASANNEGTVTLDQPGHSGKPLFAGDDLIN